MSTEINHAVLAERLSHVISRLDDIENKVDTLMSAYQQAKGAKWMFSVLRGAGLIGVGTGIVKAVEWLGQQSPPYHP